jgi:alpha-galactosidase
LNADFPAASLDNVNWKKATEIYTDTYWSGDPAPAGRRFKTKLLWSNSALYVRFEASQSEPLVVADSPDLTKKTMGLWERDVCEIFIAPDRLLPNHYFEFEIAPTGEWVDLAINIKGKERETDQNYSSGMQSAARVKKDRVVMVIKVPWTAFAKKPAKGDIWAGNLFRCVGKGPERGYLAWLPTRTAKPNFHVPSAFGELIFEK